MVQIHMHPHLWAHPTYHDRYQAGLHPRTNEWILAILVFSNMKWVYRNQFAEQDRKVIRPPHLAPQGGPRYTLLYLTPPSPLILSLFSPHSMLPRSLPTSNTRKHSQMSTSKRRRDATDTPLVTDDGHAATLLARIDELRDQRELTDLVLFPGRSGRSGGGGHAVESVHAHALIMAAASPYIHTQIMRWGGDTAGAGGGGEEGGGSLTTSTASAASSSSSSTSESKRDSCTGITTQLQGREITIPEIDGTTLAAAVEFAYTGTMILDTARKEEALPILGAFQLLDMAVRDETPPTLHPSPHSSLLQPVPNPACCFHSITLHVGTSY